MPKHLRCFLILTLSFLITSAQNPESVTSSEIYEAIKKLNFFGSVLYVAAHPDDENTRLISYMSNELKARTAYLSLTRGDGGQNLIGPEIRELLGVIRTQELLAARQVDGGQQLFTRANDFGYSKHPDETLAIWDMKEVLNDVVLAIRKFKPDVIINRFDHRSPGNTHGHHTASAMLSMDAFDLANNPSAYPEQLHITDTWQPKRIFFNTSWWFYGSEENFNKVDKSNMLHFDIGVYYPLKGLSNNEVASIASSQHLSQGFGRLSQRGSQEEYIELLKGEPLGKNNTIFEGINTSWTRVNGGEKIGFILKEIEDNFNFKNPSIHLPQLLKAYGLIQNIEDNHWKTIKTEEIKKIIEKCSGLYLEASASSNWATRGETINVNIEILNRSDNEVKLITVESANGFKISKDAILEENTRYEFKESLSIRNDEPFTTPYWLNKKGSLGMYNVEDLNLIGLPETPKNLNVDFHLVIDNTPITFTKPIVYRYSKPEKGELYQPFEIIPEASATISEKVIIFKDEEPHNISVTVKAGKDTIEGEIQIAHPKDWTVNPQKQFINIAHKGDEQTFVFAITPPKIKSEGYISPIITIGNKTFTRELVEIDYNHIPFQTVLLPSESKVVRLDIEKRGENIAYIQGAGDMVPESLEQIGYHVKTITPEEITPETLDLFDAVVIGIRAYNTLDNLQFKQQQLFDFVKKGGNMIVQYNTSRGVNTENIAPYALQLSRDRVTDENAEIRFLSPNHEVLNSPNKITKSDFEGWTQERGLYFPDEWSKEFTPILSLNDPNESPKDGSLLVAKFGKGYYIYTGLSFFREFPAGVSGAYRLFANMLSIGKDRIDKKDNSSE